MIIPYRFKVVFLSFLAVFICYIDRVNISVAIIPMQEQFGWSESQVGIILGSFYFGYMITMTVGGYLADKYGGKKVLGYALLIWSLFTIITPLFAYQGLWWLILVRILMGLGEGVTFPSWHSIYARWIPFKERTRAVGFTNSGIAAGTLFGFAVAALIIANYSWEWVFYSFGLVGVFWYFFWNKIVTSYPEDNKYISKDELIIIKSEAPSKETAPKIPLLRLFRNTPFMAIAIATFCNNWSLYTFLSYLPKYINAPVAQGGMGIDLGSNIFIYSILIPSLVSMISLILGGYLADNLIKNGYGILKVRKSVNSIGFFGSAIFLYLISLEDSLINVIILLCLINICSGICAGGFGVNHADLGPKYTGSLVGISGSIGMVAAILSPIVAGYVLEITDTWNSIFYICVGILTFGGTFYLIFASAKEQFD
ncbi:MAG: MFS transporter [Gammaproteobacteria bacterium]|nr:MFS transporter [Gammaproteobacteria bacterium]|tara:strand:- start:28086 stop:29360 length:1275 start_codon:yes stop_codon:yes gene_type:complete